MRRFIQTRTGQALSHIVAAALILPSLTFGFARRAEAQLQQNPAVAVVDFRDLKNPGSAYGQRAAEALSGFFGTAQGYDVVPRETIQREVETLGLRQPLPTLTNILRVGQQLRLTRPGDSIVSGEIVDYRVRSSAQGKQADVSMRVTMTDVPSGIAVNGAGVSASSTVRSGDVSDETLINDALSSAATQAVQAIRSQTLPTATIQNTFQRSAIINQGARQGFTNGQEVIVSRGREQVATAQISDVQPGSATIVIKRSFKGLQPGDRVRAIFTPPNIVPGFNNNNEGKISKGRRGNNLSGLITVVLVLGLVALLSTGGNNNSQEVVDKFDARPVLNSGGTPAVQLNWSGNGFGKGNFQTVQWQVYRDDNLSVPALVVPGTQHEAFDGLRTSPLTSYATGLTIGGFNCPNPVVPVSGTPTNGALVLGRPYQYSIELVYVLQRQDTFSGIVTTNTTGGSSNTGSGNSAGGTTGLSSSGTGNTTTGTTTTGVGVGDDPCYFVSARTNARGTATPLSPPQLSSPANNGTLISNTSTTFSFLSSATAASQQAQVTLEYVLQLSSSSTFRKDRTYTFAPITRTETGTLSITDVNTSSADLPKYIREATRLYYRIGVRNLLDKPGPKPDPLTNKPYIFSAGNLVVRPGTPPPPPGS
jgi:hypothetical protein